MLCRLVLDGVRPRNLLDKNSPRLVGAYCQVQINLSGQQIVEQDQLECFVSVGKDSFQQREVDGIL
jgi:hypothetical protein